MSAVITDTAGQSDRLAQTDGSRRCPCRPVPSALPPRLLQFAADGPGRSPLRAGDAPDAGERGLRRYPLPGRSAPQEAGRHLLDAVGGGDAGGRAGAGRHLGIPAAVPDRRHACRAADLLDRQQPVRAGRGFPRRRHAGRHRPAGGGGAHGQDRRGPVRGHPRRPRGAGRPLAAPGHAGSPGAGPGPAVLGSAGRRHPAEGTDHPAGYRRHGPVALGGGAGDRMAGAATAQAGACR